MTDLLLDCNSLFARSWFAAQRVEPDGAHAIAYAVRTLCLLLNPDTSRIGRSFDRILFAWDGQRKAAKKRDEKPREYHETKSVFKVVLGYLFGGVHAEHPDYEADDILATAVHQSRADENVYIVSGDKDLMQLEGGNTRYYCLNNKAVLSGPFINHKWYIKHPSQLAIALAIIGDPVDNIDGVPKWGPKKVRKLFESIPAGMPFDQVVEAIDEQVPPELKDAFWSSLERTLLHFDVPDVPRPGEILLLKPDEITGMGIPGIDGFYQTLWRSIMVEPF